MTNRIDLHVHTSASDGTLTPAQAVAQAKAAGITLMAITDHDTVAGVGEALEAGKRLGVEVIPGIEISAEYNGVDTHILGYGVDVKAESLRQMLEWIISERDSRNERIAALMQADGIDVSVEALRARYPGATIGRPHFARVMFEQGRVNSVPEAFQQWLSTGKPYYLPRKHLSFAEGVECILSAGGIPVLAHPLQYGYSPEKLRTLVADSAALQIGGMEIYYTGYTAEDHRQLESLAVEFGLFVTGGSDFHGENKPAIRLGELKMPKAVGEELKRRLAR